jgi:hypothetical protein
MSKLFKTSLKGVSGNPSSNQPPCQLPEHISTANFKIAEVNMPGTRINITSKDGKNGSKKSKVLGYFLDNGNENHDAFLVFFQKQTNGN